MFLPKDVRCIICSKIFCCAKCRKRHQTLEHVEKIQTNHLNLDCPICNGVGPFILHKIDINSEKLLDHIVREHMPMQCKKCFKMFSGKSNFLEVNSVHCKIEIATNLVDLPHAPLETIPEREINNNNGNSNHTKMVVLQSQDQLVAQSHNNIRLSMSMDSSRLSFRNVSSITKINDQSSATGDHTHKSPGQKLVRTTSTPMQQETLLIDLNPRHTPDSSTGGHVMMISSISQHTPVSSGSGSDSDNSSHNPNNSSSFVMKKPSVPKPRNKMLMAATPLRQIMSKSIQRAIVEHGIKSFNEMREHSSRSHSDSSLIAPSSPRVAALDLRTTPAIRRSDQTVNGRVFAENCVKKKSVDTGSTCDLVGSSGGGGSIATLSSTNLSTDQPPSVYETCKSSANIDNNLNSSMMTPKNSLNQGNIKKAISFTASKYDLTPSTVDVCASSSPSSMDDSENEVWYTPSSVLTRSQSCSILEPRKTTKSSYAQHYHGSFVGNDVFYEKSRRLNSAATAVINTTTTTSTETNRTANKIKSGLWSLVASTVMKIKSFGGSTVASNNLKDTRKLVARDYDSVADEDADRLYTKRRKLSHHSHIPSYRSSESGGDSGAAEMPSHGGGPRLRKIHCRPAITGKRK